MPHSTEANPESLPYKASYGLYLAILLWSPIPIGSHLPVYKLLLACLLLLCGMLFCCEAAWRRERILDTLRPFRLPLFLLASVVVWAFAQTLCFNLDSLAAIVQPSAVFYRNAGLLDGAISIYPANTVAGALLTLGFLVFFVLSVVLNQSSGRIRLTLMVIVLSGTAQALYGSFMTLSGLEYGFLEEKTDFRGVATGTFGARNMLAGYLELCLACGIGLLISTLGKEESRNWTERLRLTLDALLGPKIRLRIYLALMVIALVLTRSRMGNTAFFSALFVCGLLYMLLQRKINWNAIVLFASLALVDFLIVGQWFGFDQLVERLESTSLQEEDERTGQVQDALSMVRESTLAGYGMGTFYANTLFQERTGTFLQHAHNDYLEFLVDLGVIGTLPLALLVLSSVWTAISAMRLRHRRLAKGAGFAASMGILALLIHALVDFNLQIPANALLFVFLLSLGWMARHHEWAGR